MKLDRRRRKFHDPWGNGWGNREGSVIRLQYQVGKVSLSRETLDGHANIHRCQGLIDKITIYEGRTSEFVRSTKRSIERLKR